MIEIWLCAYPSCIKVIVFEREVVYSKCRVLIPQWRPLCGRSCVDIVELLLCRRGRRAVARALKHITVFAFDLFSLFISCIASLDYIHMLDIVCVPTLVFNQESF